MGQMLNMLMKETAVVALKDFQTLAMFPVLPLVNTKKCFKLFGFYGKRNGFAFIGDSRTQQLYLSMKQYLTGSQLKKISFKNNVS